jgi:transporter family protein
MKTFWFAIATAVFWGSVPLLEKVALAKGINPALGVVIRNMGSFLAALALLAFLSTNKANFRNFTWDSAALLMVGAMLANVVGQVFFYNALQGGDVSRVVPIAGCYPLIAFVFGILVFGEAFTLQKLAGAVLIVGGVVLLK